MMICVAQWPFASVLNSLGATSIAKEVFLVVVSLAAVPPAILSACIRPTRVVLCVIANLLALVHLVFASLMVFLEASGAW